jgi:hypothetical protein
MATWVDEGTGRTVNVDIVSFSLAELAGLDEVRGVINWVQRTVVKKVEVDEKFEGEEDGRPVLQIELTSGCYQWWSTRPRGRVVVVFAG